MIAVLLLNILFGGFYEAWGVTNSTNWSIAYKFIDYLTYSSMYMYVAFRLDYLSPLPKWVINHKGFILIALHTFGTLYLSYAFIELTYVNDSFMDYKDGGHMGYTINQSIVMAISLLAYIVTYKLKKTKSIYLWI